MSFLKFNGLLKEIIERYPNVDTAAFLGEKLQLSPDKAEELAARIEKKYCLNASKTDQKPIRVLEIPDDSEASPKECAYSVDCLSANEFVHFIAWLLGELGYEVQPEKYLTDSGVDLVAVKEGEKIVFVAKKYPKNCKVTDSIVLMAQQAKQRYGCSRAIVITTAYFTPQALNDAKGLGVELWDRDTLDGKIAEASKNVELEMQSGFPKFKGSLLVSLLALSEIKDLVIEPQAGEKYDLYLLGVKYPLLTFQACSGVVTRCVYRIRYNEPVNELEGEALIGSDDANNRFGPDDAQAYELITQYLEQFLL